MWEWWYSSTPFISELRCRMKMWGHCTCVDVCVRACVCTSAYITTHTHSVPSCTALHLTLRLTPSVFNFNFIIAEYWRQFPDITGSSGEAMGWKSRGSNPGTGKICFSPPNSPYGLWGPPSLPFSRHRSCFPGIKRPGRDVDYSPTSAKIRYT
jgi:hypothetical protein